MNNIGQRIKQLRKTNDLTQEKLAEYLGVTDKAVSKWECGLTMPDLALILPLARILHVSADELLGGKPEETDAKRLEYDERYANYLKYDTRENYQIALQAVSEYPNDCKYLAFLAQTEMFMAYCSEFKEDPTAKYSVEMLERAIKHNDMVIEECEDAEIRGNAIWNAMVCCKNMEDYDRAKRYAEMFPTQNRFTKDSAMEMCLQGDELVQHKKWSVYKKLQTLCIALSRIYYFAERGEPYVIAALDTEEEILKAAFPDGKYLEFHKNLCCAYQKRAEFAVLEGNYDGAMAYLQIMMDHARSIPVGEKQCPGGMFEGIVITNPVDYRQLYVINGMDDINIPIPEQLKNRMRKEQYAPLFDREDFQALLRS